MIQKEFSYDFPQSNYDSDIAGDKGEEDQLKLDPILSKNAGDFEYFEEKVDDYVATFMN